MLLLTAVLALAAPPQNSSHSWLSVGYTTGVPVITMVEPKGKDGVVAEIQSLLVDTASSESFRCAEGGEYVMCAVTLQDSTELFSVDHNYGEIGTWSVYFRGPAAIALHAALCSLEDRSASESMVSSRSQRLICESAEKACVIRNN